MSILESNSVLVRASKLPEAKLSEDELVALDLNKEKYYGMSGSASRIWTLLATETTLDELCLRLMEEFDVTRDVCVQETREFVEKLLQANLIKILPSR